MLLIYTTGYGRCATLQLKPTSFKNTAIDIYHWLREVYYTAIEANIFKDSAIDIYHWLREVCYTEIEANIF